MDVGSRWRAQAARGEIVVGTTVRFSRTFGEAEVRGFEVLTRDYNPVHGEPRFAALKGFDGPICHGLLVGAMICELGGQWAWLASGMNFRFLLPVRPGDTVTCSATVTALDERGRARVDATFDNQRGERVLLAELFGFLPVGDERGLLAAMIAEGDPTNGIAGER